MSSEIAEAPQELIALPEPCIADESYNEKLSKSARNGIQHIKPGFVVNNIVKNSWSEYTYPEGYLHANGKILKRVEKINKSTNKVDVDFIGVSNSPFIICGKSNQLCDGTIYLTIRYASNLADNGQYELKATMKDLSDPKIMHGILTGHGINVSANMKSNVIDYISESIKQLGQYLKVETAITQNGWNDDLSLFVMGRIGVTVNGLIDIHTLIDTDKHVLPFRKNGTLEGWVKAVNPMLSYPKPRYVFYDAMSAPLYKITKVEQNTLVIVGDSSQGKTATAETVSSTLGNPKDENSSSDCLTFLVGNS